MKGVKRQVEIYTDSKEETIRIGTSIHQQLVGNQDYIDNNIILNCTDEPTTVSLYIFEECKELPKIVIDFR